MAIPPYLGSATGCKSHATVCNPRPRTTHARLCRALPDVPRARETSTVHLYHSRLIGLATVDVRFCQEPPIGFPKTASQVSPSSRPFSIALALLKSRRQSRVNRGMVEWITLILFAPVSEYLNHNGAFGATCLACLPGKCTMEMGELAAGCSKHSLEQLANVRCRETV